MTHTSPNAGRSFALLALINLFVGGMVGLERTVLPLLGQQVFGLGAGVTVGAFIVSFSLSKALLNLFAGVAADRYGRKGVLVTGWALALPVPMLLIWAPSWAWVLVANALLGANQALTWSMTVNMMVDLVPPERRGFAAGVNEFSGYLGVSLLAFATGLVASHTGPRPEPFYLGLGVGLLGLGLSLFAVETIPSHKPAPIRWVTGVGTPSLLGLATNFKDGLVWLALPLLLTDRGLNLYEIGVVAGLYPLVWAVGQPVFGPLSDRVGRRALVAPGMAIQGGGLVLLASVPGFAWANVAAVTLGLGTALVYPTLIASVADRVAADKRATALGIYRFFRDGGYALGAVTASAGLVSLEPTLLLAGLVLASLTVLAWRGL